MQKDGKITWDLRHDRRPATIAIYKLARNKVENKILFSFSYPSSLLWGEGDAGKALIGVFCGQESVSTFRTDFTVFRILFF